MKLLHFHFMPYTSLPEDFPESDESIWVTIKSEHFDPVLARKNFRDYLDQIRYADRLGFDGISVNEHHANAYSLMGSPQMMATVMARESERAAILIMGQSIACYDPPQRVAEEMATIDVMSGGRLIAGFPVGTPFDTVYAMGQNPSSVRQKYYEAHEIVKRCWTDKELFAFNGNYYKQPFVNTFVKPAQKPNPPIWVPGGGAVETWRWSLANNYLYSYTSYYGAKAAEDNVDGYWRMSDEMGLDRNPFRFGFVQFVGVGESLEHAMEIYREPAEFFYNYLLKLDPNFSSPPGYVTEETKRMKMISMTQKAAEDKKPQQESKAVQAGADSPLAAAGGRMTIEYLFQEGYMLLGSPDEVAEQIRTNAKRLNYGNLMAILHFGNMKHELANYNAEQFARYVKPQVEGMWEDEWEHHWWPQTVLGGLKPLV